MFLEFGTIWDISDFNSRRSAFSTLRQLELGSNLRLDHIGHGSFYNRIALHPVKMAQWYVLCVW